ncbi:MAG: tRNA lysidine(34) synthetase TilS [Acidobacteria bacterium]|nr:tRNA lysidine(34) synthetase TilS [Acidobacteriota bacterium]
MADLVEQLRARHGELLRRCAFPAPGTALTCGVSGGADSLALLLLAVAAGCRVTAVHVDHGLRTGSAAEAEMVAAVAARFGAEFRAERIALDPGPNLEARARRLRHEVLGPDAALGHTADDRAETILLNLLRGAGLDGLAGIRPGPRHPIVELRRAETEAVCVAEDLVPFVDPSNRDPAFLRNRIRHELLPLLRDLAHRDAVPVLVRQGDLLAAISDHLRSEAAALDVTDARALAAADVVVARVAIREWLRIDDLDAHPPDAATVERVLAVARLDALATDVGGGRRVERTAGRLRLVPGEAEPTVG